MSKQMVMGLMCVVLLAVSGAAFGYGLDGTRGSADFVNGLGPYPAYANWSYEGGTLADPLEDALGNNPFSEYNETYNVKSSDGNVMSWYNYTTSFSGFYTYLPTSAYFWPDMTVDNGLTVEWKVKVNSLRSGSNGLYLGLRDGKTDWYVYLNPADKVTGPGGLEYAVDINEWHTYRLTILGQDGGTPKANFYVDQDLAFTEMTSGSSSDKILWGGIGWDSTAIDADHDYIRIDATGAWAPVPEPTTLLLLGGGLVGLLRRRR